MGVHIWRGDGFCDDLNNFCGCNWDGGDCCGNKKGAQGQYSHCKDCKCYDPEITKKKCQGRCKVLAWKGDKTCDDANNNCGCDWDGGDCCGKQNKYTHCINCQCKDQKYILLLWLLRGTRLEGRRQVRRRQQQVCLRLGRWRLLWRKIQRTIRLLQAMHVPRPEST